MAGNENRLEHPLRYATYALSPSSSQHCSGEIARRSFPFYFFTLVIFHSCKHKRLSMKGHSEFSRWEEAPRLQAPPSKPADRC